MSAFCDPETTTSSVHSSGLARRAPETREMASTPPSAPAFGDACERAHIGDHARRRLGLHHEAAVAPPGSWSRERGRRGGFSPLVAQVLHVAAMLGADVGPALPEARGDNDDAIAGRADVRGRGFEDSGSEHVKRSTSVSVRKTCASRSRQRLYTGLKSGPRWWTTGCDMAASTSGRTGVRRGEQITLLGQALLRLAP